MRTAAALAALVLWSVSSAAQAQVERDPEATLVEELIVPAAAPGPAWWKAEKNGKTVYILGMPTTLPLDLEWDKTALRRRIGLADRIVLPAQYRSKVEPVAFDLQAALPPALYERVEAARVRLGQPRDRYENLDILGVAGRLSEDFRHDARLSREAGYFAFKEIAKDRWFAPVYEPGEFKPAGPVSAAEQTACLAEVLDAVEAGKAAFQKAGEAWARGEMKTALAGPKGDRWWRCAAPHQKVLDTYVNYIDDAVASRRVKVVAAAIPIHTMVAEGGVVQRLRAAGYKVTDPSTLTAEE